MLNKGGIHLFATNGQQRTYYRSRHISQETVRADYYFDNLTLGEFIPATAHRKICNRSALSLGIRLR
jgi:hypothetical protein